MTADEILDAHGVPVNFPTLIVLARVRPAEWLIVVDAIIDRTLHNDGRRMELELILDPSVIQQRWHERQLASVELLPPLLPWFIKGRL